jgi:hypothetical protein
MLEEAATKRAGATLARSTSTPRVGNALLQAVRSQSIPTVVAFRDGSRSACSSARSRQDEIDRSSIRSLPTDAEIEAKEAADELATGDVAEAEQGFRDALAKRPDNREAALAREDLVGAWRDRQARPLIVPHLPDLRPSTSMRGSRLRNGRRSRPTAGRLRAARRRAYGDWTQALEDDRGAPGAARRRPAGAGHFVRGARRRRSARAGFRRRLAAALF